jgi:citrate lyase subunit beta/citryl-CoA lyase
MDDARPVGDGALRCTAPLFVPAHRSELFAKAAGSAADAFILDLEDAVALDRKDEARSSLSTAFADRPIFVRINAVDSVHYKADIAAVLRMPFAAVMLPKADLRAVEMAVRDCNGALPVIALVETAGGIADARGVAQFPGVGRLAFGSVDYCADIDATHGRESLLSARSEIVLASRLAGLLAPIDGVTLSFRDAEEVRGDASHARSLGFGGKLCIHPNQIEPVLTAFMASEDEIAWAHKILASGDGASAIEGTMVDLPVRTRALAVLKAAGRLDPA